MKFCHSLLVVMVIAVFHSSIPTAKAGNAFNATKAQTIGEWTNAIPALKISYRFRDERSWLAEQRDPALAPVLSLTGSNGQTVDYSARLIGIDMTGEHIQSVQLQSQWMSVQDTRQFGDSLLQMMSKNDADFNA
jgi:hypothetical protein